MPDHQAEDWQLIAAEIALSASIAHRILAISPQERAAALQEVKPFHLRARTAEHLADSISQARELVTLLERAEAIWLDLVSSRQVVKPR